MRRALQTSSLTFGGRPFHAVMDIGVQGEEYSGRVEVWWINDSKYRVVLSSPKFSQEKVVNGDAVSEKFAPYVTNGKATYYKGDVVLTAP